MLKRFLKDAGKKQVSSDSIYSREIGNDTLSSEISSIETIEDTEIATPRKKKRRIQCDLNAQEMSNVTSTLLLRSSSQVSIDILKTIEIVLSIFKV